MEWNEWSEWIFLPLTRTHAYMVHFTRVMYIMPMCLCAIYRFTLKKVEKFQPKCHIQRDEHRSCKSMGVRARACLCVGTTYINCVWMNEWELTLFVLSCASLSLQLLTVADVCCAIACRYKHRTQTNAPAKRVHEYCGIWNRLSHSYAYKRTRWRWHQRYADTRVRVEALRNDDYTINNTTRPSFYPCFAVQVCACLSRCVQYCICVHVCGSVERRREHSECTNMDCVLFCFRWFVAAVAVAVVFTVNVLKYQDGASFTIYLLWICKNWFFTVFITNWM